jgi:hypothetical protein
MDCHRECFRNTNWCMYTPQRLALDLNIAVEARSLRHKRGKGRDDLGPRTLFALCVHQSCAQ